MRMVLAIMWVSPVGIASVIAAKILAVDTSCQTDLIRESSHKYFLSVLQDDCMMPQHRTWAAFILASIVHNYKEGAFIPHFNFFREKT